MKKRDSFYLTRIDKLLSVMTIIMMVFILNASDLSGQEYAIGADLSFLGDAEERGFEFKENDSTKAGVLPEMVQIGNEVINGMLWPDGRIPANWDNFAELVQAGINGINAGCDSMNRPKIMIHIDKGGNKKSTKYFFDKFLSYNIDFDYIGQSYYPWWHGTLLDLRNNMIFMAEAYKKPIILVEVAYCASPTEYKVKRAPFPETPDGQKEFLDQVNNIVLQTPDNLGAGIFWWEPATFGGRLSRDFFDEKGNVLPVITVFDKYTRR